MDELSKLKKYFPFLIPLTSIFFIIFLVLLVNNSSADAEVIGEYFFRKPFEDSTVYGISSPFGSRKDPFGGDSILFHNGLDLSAPMGTNVISIGDGEVYEIGFDPMGLGNYVYIKHDFGGLIYYSAYGHMLNDSIVVEKGQNIKIGTKIGEVGSTGNSTGYHLHLTILDRELIFDKDHLLDPYSVIDGL